MQKNAKPARDTVWTKLAALKEDKIVGSIVRRLDHSEELHRISLAIVVERQQPGAAYTPLRFERLPSSRVALFVRRVGNQLADALDSLF